MGGRPVEGEDPDVPLSSPLLVTAAWVALGALAAGSFLLSLSLAVYGGSTGRPVVGRYGAVGCLFAAVIGRSIWGLYRATER